jgi:hypothetical protein
MIEFETLPFTTFCFLVKGFHGKDGGKTESLEILMRTMDSLL